MARKKRKQRKGTRQGHKVKVPNARSKPQEHPQRLVEQPIEDAAAPERGSESVEACKDDVNGGEYGVLGLVNLRNTCYFNSVVQTLVSSRELQAHFSAAVPNKRGGPVTEALREIFAQTRQKDVSKKSGKANAFRPTRLLEAVRKACPTFKDEEVRSLPRDSTTSSEEKRQSTFVAKTFCGNFVGTVSCNSCGFVKSDKEEFFEISVPIVRPVTAAAQNPKSAGLCEDALPIPSEPQRETHEAIVGPVVERTDESCMLNLRGADESIETENLHGCAHGGEGGSMEPETRDEATDASINSDESHLQSELDLPSSCGAEPEVVVGCIKGGAIGIDIKSSAEASDGQAETINGSNLQSGGDVDLNEATPVGPHTELGRSEIVETGCNEEDGSDDSEGICLLDLFHIDEPEYEMETIRESDDEVDKDGFVKVTRKKKKGKRSPPQVYSGYGAAVALGREEEGTETLDTIDECLDAYFCPEDVHWKCPAEFPERRIKFTDEKPEVFIIPKGDPCRFMTDCPAVSMCGLNSGLMPPCADDEDDDENLVEEGDEGYITETWTKINFPLKSAEGLKSCLRKQPRKPKAPPKPIEETLNSVKRCKIWSMPKVLNVHLKRFEVTARGRPRKLNQHVKFGLELDLSRVCDGGSPEIDNSRYNLRGVVCHSGSMSGGHYIAYVLREKGEQKWYYVSDSEVQPVSEAKVLASQAYILTYERCDLLESPLHPETEGAQANGLSIPELQACQVECDADENGGSGGKDLHGDTESEADSNDSSASILEDVSNGPVNCRDDNGDGAKDTSQSTTEIEACGKSGNQLQLQPIMVADQK